MNIFYYNSVTLPIITLSSFKNFLQKTDEERKNNNISNENFMSLTLKEDMFDLQTQIRFSIDKSIALAEIFTGKIAPKTNQKYNNISDFIKEIDENINFLKSLKIEDFENSENKTFSHPIFFPNQKLVGIDIIPFFLGNMYFHITTSYDILRHFGYNLGKKDFLGVEIFSKVQ